MTASRTAFASKLFAPAVRPTLPLYFRHACLAISFSLSSAHPGNNSRMRAANSPHIHDPVPLEEPLGAPFYFSSIIQAPRPSSSLHSSKTEFRFEMKTLRSFPRFIFIPFAKMAGIFQSDHILKFPAGWFTGHSA